MALDKTMLETFGLAPLWVRRDGLGKSSNEMVQGVRAVSGERARADNVRIETRLEEDAASLAARDASSDMQGSQVAEGFVIDENPNGCDGPLAPSPPMPMPMPVEQLDWDALAARVAACKSCRLCERRTNTVFGVGERTAEWMLIGEAPGENEDKQGEPFVGQAGKLLDSMLRSLSLARDKNVYIANVIKCRPPGNRNPEPDEVARCEPYLRRQVALVKPKLIVALGRVAAQNLLKTNATISSLRGRVHQYEAVPVIVTYHPAYLLRSLHDKAKAWADLCLAQDIYRQRSGVSVQVIE